MFLSSQKIPVPIPDLSYHKSTSYRIDLLFSTYMYLHILDKWHNIIYDLFSLAQHHVLRFIYVVNVWILHSFILVNNILLYEWTTWCESIHQSLDLWFLHVFWLQWKILLETFMYNFCGRHIFLFLLLPISENAVLYNNSMFNSWRNCQTIFQIGYPILYSHQQYTRISLFSLLRQYFLLSVFFILGILVGIKWYLIGVLIGIFPMTKNIEYFLMWLLVVSISSLGKCLFKHFAHFQIGLFPFYN